MIDEAADKLRAAALKTEVVVKEEDPKRLLIAEAESWGADCIFVGARGMGRIERFLLGSVSSAVAARAHCSVEVAHDQKERLDINPKWKLGAFFEAPENGCYACSSIRINLILQISSNLAFCSGVNAAKNAIWP